MLKYLVYTLRNKGTKAVTGAVPSQRIHFGTLKLHISTVSIVAYKVYIFGPNMHLLKRCCPSDKLCTFISESVYKGTLFFLY